MTARVFSRLTDRVLARLGRDAILRGAPAVPKLRVAIEHGVEVQGTYGEAVSEKVIATMPKGAAPKVGDTLVIGDTVGGVFTAAEWYRIDSPPFADNGYSVRVVLLATQPPATSYYVAGYMADGYYVTT